MQHRLITLLAYGARWARECINDPPDIGTEIMLALQTWFRQIFLSKMQTCKEGAFVWNINHKAKQASLQVEMGSSPASLPRLHWVGSYQKTTKRTSMNRWASSLCPSPFHGFRCLRIEALDSASYPISSAQPVFSPHKRFIVSVSFHF